MKNAIVIEHHFGDDGDTPEGKILRDLPTKRFEILAKQGLIREATAEEVEAGHILSIEADESIADAEGRNPFDEVRREAEEAAQGHIDRLNADHQAALKVESERADALGAELTDARQQVDDLKVAFETEQSRATATEEALAAAVAEIGELKAAAVAAGEKQQQTPANKKAADSANKGA